MEHNCYELRCADVGYKCSYVGKAHTKEDLMKEAAEHTAEVHHKTEFTDEEMAAINAAIRHPDEC
jgi:predicted small metal-binding protein